MPSRDATRRFLARLIEIAGEEAIDQRPDERRFFAEDSLGRRGPKDDAAELPLAVVRPTDAETVAHVLALASEAGVAVVPYGAGTGLMGGARSIRPGIVVDTARLNQIDVRASDRVVWAGAGSVLAEVDRELGRHGLCLGHDPWTFPVATVGGTISTNSLGYKGGRYGGMGDQVIALEVALADGTLLRTRAIGRHSAGPNLTRLFAGAEGTLGVITAAALRAHAMPERQELRAFRFDRFEDGFAAIDDIAALGMRPSLLDYGEQHASPWPELASREEEPPLLYLGFEGWTEEVEASIERAADIVRHNAGKSLPEKVALTFWENRHVAAERFARGQRRGRAWRSAEIAFDYIHVALPTSQVLTFRERCHATSQLSGAGLLECGLWTGPELFSSVWVLPESEGGHQRLGEVLDGLLTTAQDLGGSMEYVHGAGLRYAHLMQREHGSGLDVLRRLKAALDPADILNPGKLGL